MIDFIRFLFIQPFFEIGVMGLVEVLGRIFTFRDD
jgi:hypothetical protein